MSSNASLPPFAEIRHIHEVVYLENNEHIKRVRIIGRLKEKDIHHQTVLLTSPITKQSEEPSHLKVCVKLIYPFEACLGSLYESVGEVVLSDYKSVTLQAHTWRCVDGLDLMMYYRVVKMRRNYFSLRNSKEALSTGLSEK